MHSSRYHLLGRGANAGLDRGLDRKTVIMGLDGLSLGLARSLCQRGVWKNMKELMDSGRCTGIRSELPEVSPVNWASFFTSRGPEEHGVYGFTQIDPQNYALGLTDLTCVRAQTVWQRLGQAGQTCKIINLPCTYPAPELKGMLISGFVAPSLEGAVYPKALYPILSQKGYRLEADTTLGLDRPDKLIEELHLTINSRLTALDLFWPDQAWDLFIIVFTELDRLGHFLFHAIEDEKHSLHSDCMGLMKSLDRAAGEVLSRFEDLPGSKRLMCLADHGFAGLITEVDVNALLMAEGFLNLSRPPGDELDLGGMHPSSWAFALDPGRIYIHDRERFARGRVDQVERAEVTRQVRECLQELEHQGRKVMDHVYTADEIYPGGVGTPPDILCVPGSGFDLKAKFDRREVFGHFGRTGTHSRDDVFFYDSQGADPGRVRDVLGVLLT
ncbi:alkaline phosphatase family protein [Desulfonatronospira sp.]|uniref:alkaline phosphatase family protein n=1 Tax=Desulfonatronospira sp. TaxID=1962951 RepID=UPI0025C06E73|nr:alkaline phosphatase family protein [Desulfonatronospira sp.]